MSKATEIADLGQQRGRRDEIETAHRHQRGDAPGSTDQFGTASSIAASSRAIRSSASSHRQRQFLESRLLFQMSEGLAGQPLHVRPAPGLPAGIGRFYRDATRKRSSVGVWLADQSPPTNRARTRSRIASCRSSGVHTDVSSSARSSRARLVASRRLVFTRSPGLRGMSDGATTWHS